MDETRLSELLRQADGPVAPRGALSSDAIRIAARRRGLHRRIAATVLAALLCAAAAILVFLRSPATNRRGETMASGSGGGGTTAEIDSMDIRVRIELEAWVRLDHKRVVAWIAEVKPMDLAEAREDAARTMVLIAPRRGEVGGEREAAALYERTIALFPETSWAAAARDALARLQRQN